MSELLTVCRLWIFGKMFFWSHLRNEAELESALLGFKFSYLCNNCQESLHQNWTQSCRKIFENFKYNYTLFRTVSNLIFDQRIFLLFIFGFQTDYFSYQISQKLFDLVFLNKRCIPCHVYPLFTWRKEYLVT